MDLWPLVLTDGCRASASGRVVAADGDLWFEPPLAVALVYFEPGTEPPPRPSGLGVRVDNVDLDALEQRREKDGAVEGWAYLEGMWVHDRLLVDHQQSPRLSPLDDISDRPPCNPPPEGWPVGPVDENLDVEHAHGDEVLFIAMSRPSANQVVLVVTSDDPALTSRRLTPIYGDRLCVVGSKWSRTQIETVRRGLEDNMGAWTAYLGSLGNTNAQGQVQLSMDVVQVLPSLARYAEEVADGLLVVNPWLAPV